MRIALSFDDGLLDQFKWARGLHNFGIKGTFYINPIHVGNGMRLTLDQLKKMHNEWGHTIANHFWTHESPKGSVLSSEPVSEQVLIRNMLFAAEWLEDHGFEDGSRLIALPFGSIGGGWTTKFINKLFDFCDQIRDVGDGINTPGSKFLTAIETTLIPENVPEDALLCLYFHGNCNTTDRAFVKLLEMLTDSDQVVISSMLKEAQHVET